MRETIRALVAEGSTLPDRKIEKRGMRAGGPRSPTLLALAMPALTRLLALILLVSACSVPAHASQSKAAAGVDTLLSTHVGQPALSPPRQVDPPPPAARDNDISFERISLLEGLSQSVVQCILQDSRGFMWFCTQGGLNRYDGYEFQVYKHVEEDPETLSDSFAQALHEGADGALWVGTNNGGLNKLDPETGRISRYQNDPDDPDSLVSDTVWSIYEDPQGNVWVGTAGGLDRLDPETGRFTHYQNDPTDPQSPGDDTVWAIQPDHEGALWLGTSSGLYRLELETGRFTRYAHDPEDPHSLSADVVQAVYEDRSGTLWVGTNGGGLNKFDRQTGGFAHFQHDPEEPQSISEDIVLSIYEDDQGVLWVGTAKGGVNRLERETGQFIHYRHDPRDPFSLSNDQVWAIYQDRSGVLWFGTFGGGLSLFDRSRERFVHYEHDPDDLRSLIDNQVWSILQDTEGVVWIGTGAGLERFDRATGQFTHHQSDPDDPSSLSHSFVTAIHESRRGELWVGTWDGSLNGGLDKFDRDTGRFVHYASYAVFGIAEDREGALWLATLGSGLGRLDPDSGALTFYQPDPDDPSTLSDAFVTSVESDQDGYLWVGTFVGGLNRFDSQSGQSIRYQSDPDDETSISSDTVLGTYVDGNDTVWVATTSGLNRFDRGSESFVRFSEADGLANDSVYGILEDDAGNLWMSTNGGLSRFNPRDGTFRNYDVTDGLQSNEFNQGAYFKNDSGEMFFGGINGFNVFHPASLSTNVLAPPVVVTSLTQAGEDVVLDQPVDSVAEVTFRWPNNFFEFEFAALSYAQREENRYAYKLEGFEEAWNATGTRRFGRYTNLPGGTYDLRIRAANNDGVWNDVGTSFSVTVVPPFWQTWWFRILAVGLVAAGTGGFFALRVRNIEAQRRQLEIQVDQRTRQLRDTLTELERSKEAAEAANRAKSFFLANMSHELRTPLNAILGFAQLMERDANLTLNQRDNLEIINRSGEHLLGLINEVLDLSKIEAGRMRLHEGSFDLYRLLDGLEEMFRLRAERKGLTLIFERAANVPRYVWMDEGKLRQILMNLLGNAVKFTEVGGVALRVAAVQLADEMAEGLRLTFAVEDSGPGVSAEELETLFVPFEQTASGYHSQEGTGLGLAISQQYARLMDGDLTVNSPVSSSSARGEPGSVFTLDVPAAVAHPSAVHGQRSERRVIGLAPEEPSRRVLIVEDNWANRRLLVQLLEPMGFEAREAANGKEALDLWESWSPHVILMDMRMPVMDGYEATRRIKATTKGQATVIVALTASALEGDRAVILSEGCDAFVRKPFREAELFAVLADLLGVRFAYEDGPAVALPAAAAPPGEKAASADLTRAMAALPPDVIAELELATVRADLDRISSAIDDVYRRDEVLADGLADLAREFDHDGILSLIESARASQREGAAA